MSMRVLFLFLSHSTWSQFALKTKVRKVEKIALPARARYPGTRNTESLRKKNTHRELHKAPAVRQTTGRSWTHTPGRVPFFCA